MRLRMWLILDDQLLFLIAWSPFSLIINCFNLLMEQKKRFYFYENISGLSFSYLSLLAACKRFIEFFFYYREWIHVSILKIKKNHFKIILHLFGEYIFNKTCFLLLLFIFWENNQMQACKIISYKYERTEVQNLMTPLSALWSRLKYWSPLFL